MNVVLTICSANYLAHAKVLGDSLATTNPDYQFIIGLVDEVPKEIDLATWLPYEVIPVAALEIPEFQEMAEKYDIVELNTAVKPFYMEFLYRRDSSVECVIYLDPDILVLGSFAGLAENLRECNLIVTPHSCTYDHSDLVIDYEISMLCTGIYNLGFIATRRTDTTFEFLRWWQRRLVNHCYYNAGQGAFVDQQWVILAPLYFDGVFVLKDPGYNISYWNHFERKLGMTDKGYVVNELHEVIFFHFSSYSPLEPDVAAKRCAAQTNLAERPDLKPLYDEYRHLLLTAGFLLVQPLKCCYGRQAASEAKIVVNDDASDVDAGRGLKTVCKKSIKKAIGWIPNVLRQPLARATRFIANSSEN